MNRVLGAMAAAAAPVAAAGCATAGPPVAAEQVKHPTAEAVFHLGIVHDSPKPQAGCFLTVG